MKNNLPIKLKNLFSEIKRGNFSMSKKVKTKNSKLKLAILESKKYQYQIAAIVGITETRLSCIVNLRVIPTRSEMRRIAEVLDKLPSELFENIYATQLEFQF
jgi:transcriptional regulator with XRE-family HTH domain